MRNFYYRKLQGLFLALNVLMFGFVLSIQPLEAAYAPPEIENQRLRIKENRPNGTVIGEIEAVNADSYSLVLGSGEEVPFTLDTSTGILTVSDSARLDYELNTTFEFRVQVINSENVSEEALLTVEVEDVADPEIISSSAVNITESSALLEGVFNSGGGTTIAAFQYGETLPLPDFDPRGADGSVVAPAGATDNQVASQLTGLTDSSRYFFRLVTRNSGGTFYGATKDFRTLSTPEVESIVIRDQNPTYAEEVSFLVTFSEAVTGLDIEDFKLVLDPVSGEADGLTATISKVEPLTEEGTEYVVTVSEVIGDGTVELVFVDNGTVISEAGVDVGGAGAGNGTFDDGELYTIDQTSPGAVNLIYTNEDVSARHFFSVTNDPDNPEDLTVTFASSNPEVIGTGPESYEIVRNGNHWEIQMFPTPNVHGETTIMVYVVDGVGLSSEPIVLQVVVRAVADAPILVANNQEITEDETVELGLSATLADQDGSETLEQIKLSGVDPEVTLSNGSPNADGTVYTFANAAELEALTFTPPANASGEYTMTLSAVSREVATGDFLTKKTASASNTFTVTVNAINDAPAFALVPPTLEVVEDFTETHYVAIRPETVPADEEEQLVEYTLAVQNEGEAPIANVVIENDEQGSPRLKITSKEDLNGSQIFIVTANDGQGENNNSTFSQEFALTVTPRNDAPSFELSSTRVEKDEDFEGTVVVTLEDDSPENEEEGIRYNLSPAPEEIDFAQLTFDPTTGTITINAVPDMSGQQEFEVVATDGGMTASQPFTLIVNPINDTPEFTLDRTEVVVEEDFETTEKVTPSLVLPFPFGETEEEVTYRLSPASVSFANVSIDPATGVVSITSVEDQYGEQVFEIKAIDNGIPIPVSSVKTFLLRVRPVSDEPELANALEDQLAYEDAAYSYTIPEAAFVDPDGEALTYTASLLSGEALPAWISFDAASRMLSGLPDAPEVGEYKIQVVAATENGQSVADDFVLTVMPVNDLPTISGLEDVVVALGDNVPPIVFTVADEETPASELQVSVVADNGILLPESTIQLSGEGAEWELLLSPALEEFGTSEMSVAVSDGEGETVESFLFTVDFRELALDIPTLITPNGDGANDTWNIRFLSLYENSTVRVFDRSGRLVFETKNYLNGPEWNGTEGGSDLPEGPYFYEIILNSGKISRKGVLTIAR